MTVQDEHRHRGDLLLPMAVHIESAAPGVQLGAQAHHPARLSISTKTLVFLAAGFQDLAPMDPLRDSLVIQTYDSDIVLCHSLGQAQDPVNQTVGLAQVSGFLVSKADTGPMTVPGTDRLWVAAPAPARVSVIIVRKHGEA